MWHIKHSLIVLTLLPITQQVRRGFLKQVTEINESHLITNICECRPSYMPAVKSLDDNKCAQLPQRISTICHQNFLFYLTRKVAVLSFMVMKCLITKSCYTMCQFTCCHDGLPTVLCYGALNNPVFLGAMTQIGPNSELSLARFPASLNAAEWGSPWSPI